MKKGIYYRELTIKEYSEDKHFECCGIIISNHKLIIICLYRIPGPNTSKFITKLDLLLFDLTKKYKRHKIILAGDFNINTLKSSSSTTDLQNLAKNYNLRFHITEPTRQQSCIDHLLSNIEEAFGELFELGLSDHNTAQMLNVPVDSITLEPQILYTINKDYCDENARKFHHCLAQLSFFEAYNEPDLNSAFNSFYDIFILFYKLCFPVKQTKSISCYNRPKWITTGIKKCCKTKRTLRYKFYRERSQRSKVKYQSYSKVLRNCLHTSHKIYNDKYLRNSKNKCRAAWNLIKTVKNDAIKHEFITEIRTDDKKITNSTDIANKFNNYLINLTNSQNTDNYKNTNSKRTNCSIFLTPFTDRDITNIIDSLKNTKSEGYDEISTSIVKRCKTTLAPILTHLVNLSFETGTFPEKLKLAVVKPLFKKGDRLNISDYRPIALLPIFSKIFEKAFKMRAVSFTTQFNIIKTEQFGFQSNKSTVLAAYNLTNEITKNINKKVPSSVIFFDMTRAFDFVSHNILIKKLENLGFRGPAIKWLTSYLLNRKQYVEITGLNEKCVVTTHKSDTKTNACGVPQGSVLGPLLFLLYINDLPDVTGNKCTLFADDISIIISFDDNISNYENDFNNTINNVISWLNDNNLNVNLTKTNYIQFQNYGTKNLNLNINYNNTVIKEVEETKFLGIFFDKQLNWKSHIHYLTNKLNRYVYVLSRLQQTSSQSTTLAAYHGYVSSVLRYGLIVWGNSTDVNKAFIAQKKCVRAMCGVPPYESCKPLFKKLNILPLPCMYIYELAMFTRTNPQFFKRACDIYPRNTRNPDRLVYDTRPKTALYLKQCQAMCIKVFNALPKHIKILEFKPFKVELLKWLRLKNFYSVNDMLN